MKPTTQSDINHAIKTITRMKLQNRYPDMPKERWTEIKAVINDTDTEVNRFSTLDEVSDYVINKVFGDIEKLGVLVGEAKDNPFVDSTACEQLEWKYKEFTGNDANYDPSIPF